MRRLHVDHSFDDVVSAELNALIRYATALCGEPEQARDIVQDVLTRAYQRWDTIGRTSRPGAYLMTMVTNEFLTWRRRWSTRNFVSADARTLERAATTSRASAPDQIERIIQRSDLESRLARLPRRQQAALVLRFYEGLDYTEAAAVLGCAEGTVRSACSRGLAALRLQPGEGAAEPATASTRLDPS